MKSHLCHTHIGLCRYVVKNNCFHVDEIFFIYRNSSSDESVDWKLYNNGFFYFSHLIVN